MGHYAFLNMQNIVTEVITGKDETDGPTNWEIHYGNLREQVCKRTSYNTLGGCTHKEKLLLEKIMQELGTLMILVEMLLFHLSHSLVGH